MTHIPGESLYYLEKIFLKPGISLLIFLECCNTTKRIHYLVKTIDSFNQYRRINFFLLRSIIDNLFFLLNIGNTDRWVPSSNNY